MICEMTQKLKLVANLFDKYWYRQREFQYIEGITVEQGAQFSNKDGEQRESTADMAAGAKDHDDLDENDLQLPQEDRRTKASMDVNPHIKKLMDIDFKDKIKKADCDDCGPDPFGGVNSPDMRNHEHKHSHKHIHDGKCKDDKCETTDVFGGVNKK